VSGKKQRGNKKQVKGNKNKRTRKETKPHVWTPIS
jgi:hypothetical protein